MTVAKNGLWTMPQWQAPGFVNPNAALGDAPTWLSLTMTSHTVPPGGEGLLLVNYSGACFIPY